MRVAEREDAPREASNVGKEAKSTWKLTVLTVIIHIFNHVLRDIIRKLQRQMPFRDEFLRSVVDNHVLQRLQKQ